MRILKIILIVFLFDVLVGICIFFPIEWRDDETDFFIILPAIIIGNLLISALIYNFPTGKYKGLGRGFIANTFIAPFLFVLFLEVTNSYNHSTKFSDYEFSKNNPSNNSDVNLDSISNQLQDTIVFHHDSLWDSGTNRFR